jgi:hypothetical protein
MPSRESAAARSSRTTKTERPTFRTVLSRWTSGELAATFPDDVKRKRSWRDDEYRAKHIADEYLDTPIADWTRDTYKGVMAKLPATLGPTTRRHVAQVIHRVFELAIHPLGHVTTNPVPRLPLRAAKKVQATLPRDTSSPSAAARRSISVAASFGCSWVQSRAGARRRRLDVPNQRDRRARTRASRRSDGPT